MTTLKRPGEPLLQDSKRCFTSLYDWAVSYTATTADLMAMLKTSLNTPVKYTNKMSFKMDKVGCVFWPGTLYLVQSMDERVVIAKKYSLTDKNIVPLDADDLESLKGKGIPAKLTNLSLFTGQKGPPDDLVKLTLDKLFS
jgi:hypothetical protein